MTTPEVRNHADLEIHHKTQKPLPGYILPSYMRNEVVVPIREGGDVLYIGEIRNITVSGRGLRLKLLGVPGLARYDLHPGVQHDDSFLYLAEGEKHAQKHLRAIDGVCAWWLNPTNEGSLYGNEKLASSPDPIETYKDILRQAAQSQRITLNDELLRLVFGAFDRQISEDVPDHFWRG